MVKTELIQLAQKILKQLGWYSGAVDGSAGPKTADSVSRSGLLIGVPDADSWPVERRAVAFVQAYAHKMGLEAGPVDGLAGPQTLFVAEQLEELDKTGDFPKLTRDDIAAPLDVTSRPVVSANPNNWPKMDEKSMTAFYGKVGMRQVTLELPYPMRLAWDKKVIVVEITCHERVKESLKRVLTQVLAAYGLPKIKEMGLDLFGGCLNVRKQRGGSNWSIHSWGAAIDIDPERNQLKWKRDRATLDNPEYDKWWEIWEKEGWVSLGRLKNYDWMHIQAAKL